MDSAALQSLVSMMEAQIQLDKSTSVTPTSGSSPASDSSPNVAVATNEAQALPLASHASGSASGSSGSSGDYSFDPLDIEFSDEERAILEGFASDGYAYCSSPELWTPPDAASTRTATNGQIHYNTNTNFVNNTSSTCNSLFRVAPSSSGSLSLSVSCSGSSSVSMSPVSPLTHRATASSSAGATLAPQLSPEAILGVNTAVADMSFEDFVNPSDGERSPSPAFAGFKGSPTLFRMDTTPSPPSHHIRSMSMTSTSSSTSGPSTSETSVPPSTIAPSLLAGNFFLGELPQPEVQVQAQPPQVVHGYPRTEYVSSAPVTGYTALELEAAAASAADAPTAPSVQVPTGAFSFAYYNGETDLYSAAPATDAAAEDTDADMATQVPMPIPDPANTPVHVFAYGNNNTTTSRDGTAPRTPKRRRRANVPPPPNGGFTFVLYTANDAEMISSGVAPSGGRGKGKGKGKGPKRRRDEADDSEEEVAFPHETPTKSKETTPRPLARTPAKPKSRSVSRADASAMPPPTTFPPPACTGANGAPGPSH